MDLRYVVFFEKFNKLNEISSDLRDRTISKMKDKGMKGRAEKWSNFYVNRDLAEFKDKVINDGNSIIYGFNIDETNGKKLYILYGSPRDKKFNTHFAKYTYCLESDQYDIDWKIDKKTARLLSRIATTLNTESKYSNGIGDFKIKGY